MEAGARSRASFDREVTGLLRPATSGEAAVVVVRPDRPVLCELRPGPDNRHAARSEYARLESNQRPLPSHGSAPPLSYGRMCAFGCRRRSPALRPWMRVLRGGVLEPGVRRCRRSLSLV